MKPFFSGIIVLLLALLPIQAQSGNVEGRLASQVRKELVTMPYLSVFDNLAFQIDGSTVTLKGETIRPTIKTDAERLVKRIEGVEKVKNEIEVLPLSPNDDRLRQVLFRTIYGHPSMNLYALRAIPPIHIIVKNGNVTLEGIVARQADKEIAGVQANSVSGVFSVTNNLVVEK